jgi:hypothetical protein
MMTDINMPLWFDWLADDEWWEQLDDEQPAASEPRSWLIQAVDEAIAEEEDDDPNYQDPF